MPPDGLRALADPINDGVAVMLKDTGWPDAAVGATVGMLQVAEVSLLIVAAAGLCTWARHWGRRGRALHLATCVAAGLLAAGLFVFSVRFVERDVTALFGRWDHLLFAACAGFALRAVPPALRRYLIGALSLHFLWALAGSGTTTLLIGGGLLGFGLLHVPGLASAWATAITQAVVLASMLAALWMMRSADFFEALRAHNFYGYVLLRQISFAVEMRRGHPGGLGHYLAYMLFYPPFVGAAEIYSEFAERNYTRERDIPYRLAALKVISGQLQVWASFQIPVSFEPAVTQASFLSAWGWVWLLFVRSGLFVMGLWATIEAIAWLYGFETRPNFINLFRCENPAQFWRAWRATMTNWLIHYVYIPLGGNRARQLRNIGAAFAVSTAWHCMGMPFFAPDPELWHLAPVILWGIVNAAGVCGYLVVRRRGWTILPAATPPAVRRACKLALTMLFATFTVTLLSFRPQNMELFVPYLRVLVGLG